MVDYLVFSSVFSISLPIQYGSSPLLSPSVVWVFTQITRWRHAMMLQIYIIVAQGLWCIRLSWAWVLCDALLCNPGHILLCYLCPAPDLSPVCRLPAESHIALSFLQTVPALRTPEKLSCNVRNNISDSESGIKVNLMWQKYYNENKIHPGPSLSRGAMLSSAGKHKIQNL